MKNIALIIGISIISLFTVEAKSINNTERIVLDEIKCDVVNFDYEAELESADFVIAHNIVLQELPFDVEFDEKEDMYIMKEVRLENIYSDIPNFDYLKELSDIDENL